MVLILFRSNLLSQDVTTRQTLNFLMLLRESSRREVGCQKRRMPPAVERSLRILQGLPLRFSKEMEQEQVLQRERDREERNDFHLVKAIYLLNIRLTLYLSYNTLCGFGNEY